METVLKQRLLGAAVLVALAVTFLPMLVTDPAPVSGASDVPLKMPRAPEGAMETRELALVEPPAGAGPALASPPAPPEADDVAAEPTGGGMMPAAVAGGDYAVNFGSYATPADAARVVGALRASQLPGYQEPARIGTRAVHRVRIGPFATRADAEAARLRAAHVRDDVDAKVVVLDVPGEQAATPPRAPIPATAPPPGATVAAAKPPASKPPAAQPPAAAASVGFAVQLGAFANADEAIRLRDRARAAGFAAFVEQVRTDHGVLSRVRIGPVVDRAEADRLRTQVAGKLGIDGIVRPHP